MENFSIYRVHSLISRHFNQGLSKDILLKWKQKNVVEMNGLTCNLFIFREAWKKLGEMSSDEAKNKYIKMVKEAIDKMSKVMNVDEWIRQIVPDLSEKFALIMAS